MDRQLPTARSRQERIKPARLWWLVHQWAGLKLAILLTFVFATGTLAVLSHEIDWLLQPDLRVSPATVSGEPRWDDIATAAAAHPATASIRSIDAPVASAFAAQVQIIKPDGSRAFLYAHPETGLIQGVGPWVGAQRILRNMHRHLNLPLNIGVPLVSVLSLLMLASLISSLVVYKRWWRGFFKPVRWRDARTAWGDIHRLSGLWSLWFVALISLTGLWYLAESMGLDAPPAVEAKADRAVPDLDLVSRFPDSLAAARKAFPQLAIRRVVFPAKPGQAFRFEGEATAILVRPRANAVWTNPTDGKVLATSRGESLSVHQRISEAADPLHFGTFAGYWSKLPWFLFGCLLTMLCVSGVTIFALRLARRPTASAGQGKPVAFAWTGMGLWKWPATALVGVGLVLVYPLIVS
ncbi:MAG: PepSY domain-containing protein [Sphingomonadales bacterium]|nr:PepSY domain-containing protein [Sphingomonadales bacterium]PIX65102.1 MAG: PepSY domain-containing protein [Sphingomonadales bacterium CG_4_10_14_3_um_filter_58_15]NCO48063.1 PepSY domain-containing protein [Sphingomonadales bacterium]NCO99633.1 PepSY domain-containing protein [Sphingomonadales bacterium]NCP27196.1 PepSY domain-containing protein [Sphingomonadales bacterium]